jgi:N-acetylmuramic acid 6-phosphate etherase
MADGLLLGIEGGATRSTGVLVDGQMRVVAEYVGGPTNVHAVGRDRAGDATEDILRALLAGANVGWESVSAAAFCMAGLRTDADRSVWRGILDELAAPSDVVLTHDAAAGLAAGSEDQTGILVVCGTGSLVYARRADGAERFVGGRGPVVGDEGSGFDIARRGLRAAARAADGRGPATRLQRLLPERLGLADVEELPRWADPSAKGRIASAAPIVFDAAEAGDDVAAQIIHAAAGELVRSIEIAARALWPPGSDEGLRRIVLSGGVLRGRRSFREAVSSAVRTSVPTAECLHATVTGAIGAARIARGM